MSGSDIKKPANDSLGRKDGKMDKQSPAPSYTLIFLDAAKNLPRGTEKSTDAPYVSIGRDSSCQISYGDDYPMVSRLHAAIEWQDDEFLLKHLSNTNQTLLNDRPIAQRWYLHDDDVIQLSPSGPRIKFKRPLILNMKEQPAKVKQRTAPIEKPPQKSSSKSLYNLSLMAVIVLAILLAVLMVYLTITGF